MKTFVDTLITYFPKSSGKFDAMSRLILDYKKSDMNAVAFFESLLQDWINENIDQPHYICSVPSSTVGKDNQITKTCRSLALKNALLIESTNTISKRKSHASFCITGRRDAFMLANSLKVSDSIKGKHVLLLDDVTSTGISMYVCKKLLLEAGALSVTCVAIALTAKLYS